MGTTANTRVTYGNNTAEDDYVKYSQLTNLTKFSAAPLSGIVYFDPSIEERLSKLERQVSTIIDLMSKIAGESIEVEKKT